VENKAKIILERKMFQPKKSITIIKLPCEAQKSIFYAVFLLQES